jgi:hypothetical protein
MTGEHSGLSLSKFKKGSDKILKRVTSKVLLNLMKNGYKLGGQSPKAI